MLICRRKVRSCLHWNATCSLLTVFWVMSWVLLSHCLDSCSLLVILVTTYTLILKQMTWWSPTHHGMVPGPYGDVDVDLCKTCQHWRRWTPKNTWTIVISLSMLRNLEHVRWRMPCRRLVGFVYNIAGPRVRYCWSSCTSMLTVTGRSGEDEQHGYCIYIVLYCDILFLTRDIF